MMESITLRAPEVRTFAALEIRDAEQSGADGKWLEGRAVPYNAWADVGWFMERFAPGAFAKSIREAANKLPLLLWHDNRSFPIGVSEQWRDGKDALDVVWKIDTGDERAVEAARKATDGMLTGLSVGFAPIPESDTRDLDDDDLLWITRNEARLLEVSMTPTPAYAGAKVALVRSREGQRSDRRRSAEMDSWKRYLDTARRG